MTTVYRYAYNIRLNGCFPYTYNSSMDTFVVSEYDIFDWLKVNVIETFEPLGKQVGVYVVEPESNNWNRLIKYFARGEVTEALEAS